MIRKFKTADMEQVLDIWLNTSIAAHGFVEKEFWESKVADMRDIYLPAGETYVYDEGGTIKGFLSLYNNTLAAIFVSQESQGRGIGRQLMAKAKEVRNNLNLTVYKKNKRSIDFYKKCGFKIIKEQIDKHTGQTELLMILRSR
jgi:putative acetyltransferase